MITSLSIENYALIDKLSIDFPGGFSTITGETGAGKSILLGALSLALGKRADTSALKDNSSKCIIEACFSLEGYGLEDFFESVDFDFDPQTVIRREILPTGKSRAFVNDSPVNVQDLQELGIRLIDIHSQHETRELSEGEYQFELIDSVAGCLADVRQYSTTLNLYKSAGKKAESLRSAIAAAAREQDYTMFLLDELIGANLRSGEEEELESDLATLSNLDVIRENFDRALQVSNQEQAGAIALLKEFRSALQKVSGLSPEYQELSERSSALVIELQDIASEVMKLADLLSADPERLEFVNHRLTTINSLKKKHQASSVEELIAIRNDLDERAVSATELENQLSVVVDQIKELANQLEEISARISSARAKAIPAFISQLLPILARLGMPHARMEILLSASEEFLHNGKDRLQFLFAANKGSEPALIKKVASGGEMSRIMLAVKSVLSRYKKLPTIIFDEIDTGVSGEIANAMAEIMLEMSNEMQVLSITHLPQIAARGKSQFRVYKKIEYGKTASGIVSLSEEERVEEIARMLSGSSVAASAMTHARELLG